MRVWPLADQVHSAGPSPLKVRRVPDTSRRDIVKVSARNGPITDSLLLSFVAGASIGTQLNGGVVK